MTTQERLDRFAAAALTGYLAIHADANVAVPSPDAAAQAAYGYARAMMAERARHIRQSGRPPRRTPYDRV